MRPASRNPFKVETHLPPGVDAPEFLQQGMSKWAGKDAQKHLRYIASGKAKQVIEAAEVAPNIQVVWSYWGKPGLLGRRGVLTLAVEVEDMLKHAHSQRQNEPDRYLQVSLYTPHTLLHRLGDRIFMSQANYDIRQNLNSFSAPVAYYPPQLRRVAEMLSQHGITDPGVWLPPLVDTKACREGWIQHGSQALAELVPHLLLYRKGKEHGIRFRAFPARLLPDAIARAEVDAALQTAATLLTGHIHAWIAGSAAAGDVFWI